MVGVLHHWHVPLVLPDLVNKGGGMYHQTCMYSHGQSQCSVPTIDRCHIQESCAVLVCTFLPNINRLLVTRCGLIVLDYDQVIPITQSCSVPLARA